jgi:hypothetical protein
MPMHLGLMFTNFRIQNFHMGIDPYRTIHTMVTTNGDANHGDGGPNEDDGGDDVPNVGDDASDASHDGDPILHPKHFSSFLLASITLARMDS